MEYEVQCTVCAQVLMDPMTLSCGHSFCQLCLARLWISKSRPAVTTLQCPSCRQPWSQMPKINIQLRNITESWYGESIRERRSALTSDDTELIKTFSSIEQGPDINLIMGVMMLGCLAVGVVIVVVGLLIAWVPAQPSGEFMRKPVHTWKREDVLVWAEGLGEWTAPNITKLFHVQALTGSQLLLVTDQILVEFGIEQEFEREAILKEVEQLKIQEYSRPRDFYQFKAANRRTTLLLVMSYQAWPQFTLIYSYLFDYCTVYVPLGRTIFYTQEPEDELSWLQSILFSGVVLLFPHMSVFVLCFKWLYIHPWICVPAIVHCCIHTFTTLRQLPLFFKAFSNQIRSKMYFAGGQLLHFVLFLGVYHLVWLFVPHFICDILFYLSLWNTFLLHVVVNPLKKLAK